MTFEEYLKLLDTFTDSSQLTDSIPAFNVNAVLDHRYSSRIKSTKNDQTILTILEMHKVTALHLAVVNDKSEIATWLIANGALTDISCTIFISVQKNSSSENPAFFDFMHFKNTDTKSSRETGEWDLTALALARHLQNSCMNLATSTHTVPSSSRT